ncbi:MAG: hypothetical protein KDD52_01910 [Bdellovibrionales bacterium]|nr:hypothetical protein [Bdellovibrionales bacterium]
MIEGISKGQSMPEKPYYYPQETMSVFRVVGSQTQEFLSRIVTADISSLAQFQHTLSNILTIKGKLIAFFHLIQDEGAYWILVDREMKQPLKDQLEKYIITEDVAIEEHPHMKIASFFGKEQVASLSDAAFDKTLIFSREKIGSHVVAWVWGPEQDLYEFCESFGQKMTPDQYEDQRIFLSIPRWGIDVSSEHMPFELEYLEPATSTKKGCYPGQETVSRLEGRGRNVNKKLFQVIFPRSSSSIELPVELHSEQGVVGTLTSVSHHDCSEGKVLALAWVHRKAFEQNWWIQNKDQKIQIERYTK